MGRLHKLGDPLRVDDVSGGRAGAADRTHLAAKSKPVETVMSTDLGVTPVGWAGAGQTIVNVTRAEARAAGEIIEDDGERYAKIVALLENLKVI